MPDNEIYNFLKENGLTQKTEEEFLTEYSDSAKAQELYNFFDANNLTQKDFGGFYDQYLKKKEEIQPPYGLGGMARAGIQGGNGFGEQLAGEPSQFQSINEQNKNIPWVARGLNPKNFPNPEGIPELSGGEKTSSHVLAAEVDEKGDWYVFPTLDQDESGEWVDMRVSEGEYPKEAFDYAKQKGTAIKFDNADDAIAYSQNGLIEHRQQPSQFKSASDLPLQPFQRDVLKRIGEFLSPPEIEVSEPIEGEVDLRLPRPGEEELVPELKRTDRQPFEYTKPEVTNSLEYVFSKGYNESIIGLTQNIIQGEEPINIGSYESNMVEDATAFAISMLMDMPSFIVSGGGGAIAAKGIVKGAVKAGGVVTKKLIKKGVSEQVAKKIVTKGVEKVAATIGSSAAGLGTYGAIHEALGQMAGFNPETGKYDAPRPDAKDIDWGEVGKEGYIGTALGGGLGLFGIGGAAVEKFAVRNLQKGLGRMATKGAVKTADFIGENAVFVYGDAVLRDDRKVSDITGDDFLHSMTIIGALKISGVARKSLGKFIKSDKFTPDKANKEGFELDLSKEELKLLNRGETSGDVFIEIYKNRNVLESIMKDSKIPIVTKEKIIWSIDGLRPEGKQVIGKVDIETRGEKTLLALKNDKGELLDIKEYSSKSEAEKDAFRIMESVKEIKTREDFEKLTIEQKKELSDNLENSKFDKEAFSKALNIKPDLRTPEEKAIVQQFTDELYNIKGKPEIKGEKIVEKVEPEKPKEEVKPKIKEEPKDAKTQLQKEQIEQKEKLKEKEFRQEDVKPEEKVLKEADEKAIEQHKEEYGAAHADKMREGMVKGMTVEESHKLAMGEKVEKPIISEKKEIKGEEKPEKIKIGDEKLKIEILNNPEFESLRKLAESAKTPKEFKSEFGYLNLSGDLQRKFNKAYGVGETTVMSRAYLIFKKDLMKSKPEIKGEEKVVEEPKLTTIESIQEKINKETDPQKLENLRVELRKAEKEVKIEEVDKINNEIDSIEEKEDGGKLASKGEIKSLEKFEKRNKQEVKDESFKIYQKTIDLIKKHAPKSKILQGYTSRNALGQFNLRSKNLRLKGLNNISVSFHEISHAIDDAYGVVKNSPKNIKSQLSDVYMEYYPGAKESKPLKTQGIEGYAMLIQKYLESPTIIKAQYSELVDYFIKGDGALKQMKEFLVDAEIIIEDYQALSGLEQIGSRVIDVVNDYKKSAKKKILKLEAESVDDLAHIQSIDNEAGTVYTADDITSTIRMGRNSEMYSTYNIDGAKQQYMALNENGEYYIKHDFNWKTLTNKLNKKGKHKANEFGWWLYSRRAKSWYDGVNDLKKVTKELEQAYLETNDPKIQKEIEVALSMAKNEMDNLISIINNEGLSEKLVNKAFEEGKSEFKEESDMFDIFNKEDVELLANLKVQIIDKATKDKFLGEVGRYAPLKRAFYNQVVGESLETKPMKPIVKSGMGSLKKLSGSQIPSINPLIGAMQNHAIFTRRAHEQMISNQIYNAYIKHPEVLGQYFEDIALTPILGKETVIGIKEANDNTIIIARDKNGKRKGLKIIDPAVAKVLHEEFNSGDVAYALKVMVTASRLFKLGTTGAYPLFLINNIPLDTITRFTNTKTGIIPGIHEPKELLISATNKKSPERKYFNEYIYLAGKTQTRMGWNKISMSNVSLMRSNKLKAMGALINGTNRVIDFISAPSNISEILPRATEYIRSRKQGDSQAVALEKAGTVTGSFHHKGRMGGLSGQAWVKAIPYMNPALQVLHNTNKALKTKTGRKRFAIVSGLMGAMAGSSLYTVFNLWDEDDKKKAINHLKGKTPQELSMYMYLVSPYHSGEFLKVRVPETHSSIALGVNMYILDKYADADYSKKEIFDAVMAPLPDQLQPWKKFKWLMSLTPQLPKNLIEVGTNLTTFPEVRPIESFADKRTVPEERYSAYTSTFAKRLAKTDLGRKLELSPKMIDHVIKGNLGRATGYFTGKPGMYNLGKYFTSQMYLTSTRQAQLFFDNNSDYDKEIKYAKDQIKKVTGDSKLSNNDVLNKYDNIKNPRVTEDELSKMIKYVNDSDGVLDKLGELKRIDPDTEPKKYELLAYEIMQDFTNINKGLDIEDDTEIVSDRRKRRKPIRRRR